MRTGTFHLSLNYLVNVKDELDSLQIKFQTPFQKEFENDATNSISITNRGMILWTLKSVTRLGMFMTKTESAKLFVF